MPRVFVVIHLKAVPAGAEAAFDGKEAAGVVLPGIDHKYAVDPDSCAIVDLHCEAVDTLLKVKLPGPTHAEIVRGDSGSRTAVAPVEGYLKIIAHQ